jgi:hypothetical protein
MQQPSTTQSSSSAAKERSERVRPVEYFLVAVIASAVGVMAVPDLTPDVGSMAGLSQLTQLQYQLNNYRGAIGNYEADHHVYPGYGPGAAGAWQHGELSGVNFQRQMLLWSDEWGHVGQMSPGQKELGPYLERGLLKNPVNGLESIRLIPDGQPFPTTPTSETGWLFKPETGELRANCQGTAPFTGQSYYEL